MGGHLKAAPPTPREQRGRAAAQTCLGRTPAGRTSQSRAGHRPGNASVPSLPPRPHHLRHRFRHISYVTLQWGTHSTQPGQLCTSGGSGPSSTGWSADKGCARRRSSSRPLRAVEPCSRYLTWSQARSRRAFLKPGQAESGHLQGPSRSVAVQGLGPAASIPEP